MALINPIFSFSLSADPPSVTLQLGPSLNPDDIEEGDDCYFECIIKANPPTYKVVWRHNVSITKFKLSNFCFEVKS